MQTFQSSENPAKEEEIKPEAQEEQKGKSIFFSMKKKASKMVSGVLV